LLLLNSFGFHSNINETTRKDSGTCIDHVYTNVSISDKKVFCKLIDFDFLDHFGVEINVNFKRFDRRSKHISRSYNENSVSNFIGDLYDVSWDDHFANKDIDSNTNLFLSTISNLHDYHFPLRFTVRKQQNTPWMNTQLKRMISRKNYFYRKMKRKNTPSNSLSYKKQKNLVSKHIQLARNNYYHKILHDANSRTKWKVLNDIKDGTSNNKSAILTNSPSITDFCSHFSNIFSCRYNNVYVPEINVINNTIFVYQATEFEIKKCLLNFRTKSTKHDSDLPMFLWRAITDCIVSPLTFLVNQMINDAQFPQELKKATITPIFKKGNHGEARNYRPIAILNNLSKVFEKVILNRMVNFACANNILPDTQFGFRKNYSTKDAIIFLMSVIEHHKSKDFKSCGLFLDLTKAFDMVNHNSLIQILNSLGFRGHFSKLIQSFLTNRLFRIRKGNEYSSYIPAYRGVPQGAILSPILYSLYVYNFAKIHAPCIQYADDSSIIIPFKNVPELQSVLNDVSSKVKKYFSDLNLSINPTKTEIVLFGERNTKSLRFCSEEIHSTNSTKFLGVIVSSDCKFNEHVQRVISPKIRRMFSSLFQFRQVTNNSTKRLIFHAYITPHIIYACPFLLNCTNTCIESLNTIYKKALKILFNLPLRFPSNSLSAKTNSLSLPDLITYHAAIYAFNLFHSNVPHVVSSNSICSTRNKFLLRYQKTNFSLHNKIAQVWNDLTSQQRCATSLYGFKKTFKNIY